MLSGSLGLGHQHGPSFACETINAPLAYAAGAARGQHPLMVPIAIATSPRSMAVTADACPKYPAGPILTFRNRPIAISTACEGSANSAGAPVDLAPPGEDAREVRHHGCDRHDRHGLFGSEFIDQYRHQHDRRAGADDAGDGTGDEADDEDEKEARRLRASTVMLTLCWQQGSISDVEPTIAGLCH